MPLSKILKEYAEYIDIFSSDLAIKLPENTGTNKYAMDIVQGKQQMYRSIYNFSQVELKTLNIYIKIHLKTGFIWRSKSLARAFTLFYKKLDHSFQLHVNY